MEVREPIVAYNKKHLTIEEYLDFEESSEEKHEYFQGEVFAMAGAGDPHNEIFSNLFLELGSQLKGKGCRPYGSDKRLHIPENTLFTYPDISIYCGEKKKFEKNENTSLMPTVLISSSERRFRRSSLLGGISAAIIDFEISSARKTSKPLVFTTSDLVPI